MLFDSDAACLYTQENAIWLATPDSPRMQSSEKMEGYSMSRSQNPTRMRQLSLDQARETHLLQGWRMHNSNNRGRELNHRRSGTVANGVHRLSGERHTSERHKCTLEHQKPVCGQRGAVQCMTCHHWFCSKGGIAVHKCDNPLTPDPSPAPTTSSVSSSRTRSRGGRQNAPLPAELDAVPGRLHSRLPLSRPEIHSANRRPGISVPMRGKDLYKSSRAQYSAVAVTDGSSVKAVWLSTEVEVTVTRTPCRATGCSS